MTPGAWDDIIELQKAAAFRGDFGIYTGPLRLSLMGVCSMKTLGRPEIRVDSLEKVTGHAKYTADLCPGNALIAGVYHSTIAHGLVRRVDTGAAEAVPGVVRVITCFDAPDIMFPTAGHPWSTVESHQDICDRKLLNAHVRYYGDDVAAVIAEDEIALRRALELIKVEYDEYPACLTPEDAMAEGAVQLHERFPGNVLRHTEYTLGDYDAAIKEPGLVVFEDEFDTPVIQHCHIEPPVSWAYTENGRIVVVAATQIPHIVRRIIGQALGIPWGRVRVIKPYLGGGFGNRQDALYEPLNAWLATMTGGRPVRLEISREETFTSTRTRHAMSFKMITHVRPTGRLVARRLWCVANGGAYASHGHAVVANATTSYRQLYQDEKAIKVDTTSVYTNLAVAGAMRAYGIPQMNFACESHMDNIARGLGLDPVEFRRMNMMKEGFVDPLNGITCRSWGLDACIAAGREHVEWDKKRALTSVGNLRRGVGCAIFSYKTGVYPISLETSASRVVLNQDGSVQVQMGATEIGQGADTVFAQMAAETLGIDISDVHIVTTQDTDVAPYDPGCYASRQSYVSGMGLKATCELLRSKILDYAAKMLATIPDALDIEEGNIVDSRTGQRRTGLSEVATEAFYSLEDARHLTAEVSNQCKDNAFSFGACFAEVEVDIKLCKVKILNIIDVHDSGRILNPRTAEGQVHGGMSMALGYALSEQMLFDRKTGRLLNGNFLDYKLPTALDTPELCCAFADTWEPTGPYGNKALGEPPAIPATAAVRNAILHATGVGLGELPMTPERLFTAFKATGLEG